ncbi:MAG: PEP-CTERM sorting domain-containing protein [Verrucomicrobiales bacterium]|nr:PEP-CTERM sorting domain-containing protein [Verrucomicrobiales bacterium]
MTLLNRSLLTFTLISLVGVFTARIYGAIIVPNSLENTAGNSSSPLPFHMGAKTLQMQISADQLSGIAGSSIAGISFRLDESSLEPDSSARSFADYEITLGAALNPFGSISPTFGNNMSALGSDKVRDGALTIPSNAITSGSNPNDFSYTVAFDHNYSYAGGDLVVLITHTGSGLASYTLDGANSSTAGYGNVVGSDFHAQSDSGFNSPTATALNAVFPVIEFETVPPPIPEPSAYAAIAGLGLLGFACWRKVRQRKG